MSIYAIGDLQGCHSALENLLEAISFSPTRDRLWLVGDLVNRGPDSLAILRWAQSLGEQVTAVLGNHDLHLLTVAEGFAPAHRGDTLEEVLLAPDREALLGWLRRQPLLHREGDMILVHAGLLPQWTPACAEELAREVESVLRGPDYRDFLARMYGNQPCGWEESLAGMDRLRIITNAMTRLRFCTPQGEMEFAHKGTPDQPPPGYLPWFEVANRASRDATVIFGHWSALGLRVEDRLLALDSGCLWGGTLTAVRLEDRRVFQVSCRSLPGSRRPR